MAVPESSQQAAQPKSNRWLPLLVVILIVLGTCFGGILLSALRRTPGGGGVRSFIRPGPVPISESIAVEPNTSTLYRFEVKPEGLPGRLSGHWTSRGKSAGIAGATDDTLVGFWIKDPNNQIVQYLDHQFEGNFSLSVAVPGTYTFEFGNAGILRSSKRVVELEGQYEVQ